MSLFKARKTIPQSEDGVECNEVSLFFSEEGTTGSVCFRIPGLSNEIMTEQETRSLKTILIKIAKRSVRLSNVEGETIGGKNG